MLYNPHQNAPSWSSLEYWLETQDPNKPYPYGDTSKCVCAQYLRAVGKYKERWLQTANDTVTQMNRLAAGDLSDRYGNRKQTFGEFLDRVRLHNRQAAPLLETLDAVR